MYGCESWTIKKAECQRIDAFEPWCWRGLLRVPWIARRSNQSILKEINPECSLEGLMLKLKLQSFGHLLQRTDSLQKTLILGKIEGGRRRGWQWDGWMASPTQWTWVWASSRSWWYKGSLACCGQWGHRESDTTEGLNWTQFLSAVYWRGLLFLLTYTDALEGWGSTQWILVDWMNKYIRFTFGLSVLVLWQHLAWYF